MSPVPSLELALQSPKNKKRPNSRSGRSPHSVKIILSLEFLNATAAIDEFLLSRKERMTGRADIEPDFVFCRTRLELVTASARHFGYFVFRVNSFLHIPYLL
jgi:hypothetical protein